MNGPVEVPSLDALASDPAKAWTVSPDVARTLLCRVLVVLPALVSQSSRESQKADAPQTERWLTVEEASALFGMKPRWFRDNKDKLPHSKPSYKTLIFPEEKLRKWFASHKAS